MDKFPLLLEGRPVGELITEREALYTWFDIRCRLPEKGLWQAWAVGDQGELRLGIPEPAEGRTALRRRFSRRMTEPLGRLLRGERRAAGTAAGRIRPCLSRKPESLAIRPTAGIPVPIPTLAPAAPARPAGCPVPAGKRPPLPGTAL